MGPASRLGNSQNFVRNDLEVEDGLKKNTAVAGGGGAEESPARQGLRFAEELGRGECSVRNSQVGMIENVGRVRGERQVVPARSGLVQAPRSSTASAQTTRADSSAAAAASTTAAASSSAAPRSASTFYLGANANHFAYTHVQAGIRRPGADTEGD